MAGPTLGLTCALPALGSARRLQMRRAGSRDRAEGGLQGGRAAAGRGPLYGEGGR